MPYRLVNTFDEHGTIGDLNCYNSFIYITSLNAFYEMATNQNDTVFAAFVQTEIAAAIGNATSIFWNPEAEDNNNGHFMSFWCENGMYANHTLQGDSLYGVLWAYVLGVTDFIEQNAQLKNMFVKHLQTENLWSLSEYGVLFNVNLSNTGLSYHCGQGSSNSGAFRDVDQWESFTLDSASLYVYLLNNVTRGFEYMKIVFEHYRTLYADQWDYRIASLVFLVFLAFFFFFLI